MLKPALARFESGGRMLKPVLGQIRIRAPDAETGGGQIRIRAIPDAGPTRFRSLQVQGVGGPGRGWERGDEQVAV